MTDPAPFLSTIAAASATLVAIVGGLLVARFVALDSEQQGAQQLLDEAEGRLITAQQRAVEAREALQRWDVHDFFGPKIIEAIGQGESDIRELRRIGRYTPVSDDDLAPVVRDIADEFDRARHQLRELHAGDEDAPLVDWEDFKRLQSDLPEVRRDDVWEIAYNELAEPSRARQLVSSVGEWQLPLGQVSVDYAAQPDYLVYRFQQRDELRTAVDRTQQHAEDVEAEVAHQRRMRDAIIRPKGLGWGLGRVPWIFAAGSCRSVRCLIC